MKNFAFATVAIAALALVGCQSSNKDANMGSVNAEKKACCGSSKKTEGNMGAVGEKKDCGTSCSDKAATCPATGNKAGNMGAVSEKSSCSEKKSCCPSQKAN